MTVSKSDKEQLAEAYSAMLEVVDMPPHLRDAYREYFSQRLEDCGTQEDLVDMVKGFTT